MNKFFTVLSHTYVSRVKSKSFIISTVIILLFVTIFANLESIIEFFSSDDEKETIIVIDETNHLLALLKENVKQLDEDITFELYEQSEEEGKEAVREEAYDGLLILQYDDAQFPKGTYYENRAVSSHNEQLIEQQLQQLKEAIATEQAGVDEETLAAIYEPIHFEKVSLDEAAKTDEELDAARGIVYVMLFVLYMAVIIYGQMIAADVAVEKSSRVMEILISSASPLTHMFAKIFGIALLGITQIAVVFLYSVSIFRSKQTEISVQILQEFGFTLDNVSIYVYAFIFFILGYLLYATIAAMLGSLVSRVEDVQQLTLPLVLIVMVAFFISMFGLAMPDAKFITVTSFIPFFTPMIMFLRIGMLEIPTWEIVVSIGLLIITIILFSILAARIYRGGVLMYGPSQTLKDFRRAFNLSKKE